MSAGPVAEDDCRYSRGEELANSITHGFGLAASVAIAPILIVTAARANDAWRIVGASVFATVLILLYGSSTVYHAVPAAARKAKEVSRRVDHSMIYLLIAGTYTPFLLVSLRGPWGWSLFGVVWGLAVLGVFMKGIFGAHRMPTLSTTVYLGMGWLVIVAIHPLVTRVAAGALVWLMVGGLFYTGGVAFYVWRKRYAHAVWHLCVLGGSASHAWAILAYVLPSAR